MALVEERVRQGLPPQSVVAVTGLIWTPALRAAAQRGALDRRPMFTSIEPDGVRLTDGSLLRWLIGRDRAAIVRLGLRFGAAAGIWMPLRREVQFLRERGITRFVAMEIDDIEPDAVFDFALAQPVQMRPPSAILREIVGAPFRKQDVSSVATVHCSLRIINCLPEGVPPRGDSGADMDRPGIDAHAEAQVGMAADCL